MTLTLAVLSLLAVGMALAANPPQAGAAAPQFSLTSQEGKAISLDQFKGKWVVLYFYPKDFTSGCTIEAHNFQRDLSKYEAANAVILGVSHDTAESHKEFCAKEGLNFKLLADTDGKVSNEYGSVMEGRNLSARNTFLIGPDGMIAKTYTSVNPNQHSEQVLSDLAELQKK